MIKIILFDDHVRKKSTRDERDTLSDEITEKRYTCISFFFLNKDKNANVIVTLFA